jgi:dihydrofolate synthase / folylpolyglutamate synthase
VTNSPATAASSMPSVADNSEWLASLSPWPEEFGLDRIRALLHALSDPQRAFRSIHIVGTNGKTTTTRIAEALLADEGLAVGAYTSPHVVGWEERIRIRGAEADLERALARVRVHAEELGATQFEVLTAAAFAEFAAADADVAVVEAGLGGRHDATNVLDAPVVVLTNVSLEHTDVLGGTREEIAAEKLAVLSGGGFAVLGEPEWEEQARAAGARGVVVTGNSNLALAVAAVETFLGRPVDPGAAEGIEIPGRVERISDHPLEIWDGAHNLAGVAWLLARLPTRRYVVVASVLEDKDADGMLAALSALGDQIVATSSSNPRALSSKDIAARASRFFPVVTAIDDPTEALGAAREAAGEDGAVVVTGSLYLLADLAAVRPPTPVPWRP